MQAYSDLERETEPYALPDVEVFFLTASELASEDWGGFLDGEGDPMPEGHYWWSCFPGCLPDSEPFGPFETEAEALADAQDIS